MKQTTNNRLANVLRRLIPVVLLALMAGAVYVLDLHTYLSFDALREHRSTLTAFVEHRLVAAALLYITAYAVSTALSLPGGAVLSIAGGFMFGGWLGGLLVIIGATLGATALFLTAKTVLGDALRARAGPWLERMQEGFRENAFNYLLVLRLIPLFPFFVVNLVPAFLGVSLRTYVVATAIGIIPGALAFTFAGAGVGSLLDTGGEFSPGAVLTQEIIAALSGLALLSLLPVLYKRFKNQRRVTA